MYRWGIVVVLAACGSSVKGSAHIVKGATKAPGARTSNIAAPATSGHWLLSPNASTVTINSLQFKGDGGGTTSSLTNCTPSYQRDAAELTSILDCEFDVDTGTYTNMNISVAGEAQVTIDDAANGLWTDPAAPTKLVTTQPAGGAKPVTITVPTAGGGNSIESGFVEPLEVAEGHPVEVTILEDMIHTVAADVNGGTATFDLQLPLPPVALIATADTVTSGSVEYYAPSGSADNWTMGMVGSGNEAGSARFFFVNGKPQFVWHVVNANSEAWASDPRGKSGSRTGGYLGLDATGTLCWAHTSSDSLDWPDNGYSMLCAMKRATNIGEQTTIGCAPMSSVPAPTSGSTYESGCPSFTPSMTLPVTLVAR